MYFSDGQRSRLSVFSTSASENQTLQDNTTSEEQVAAVLRLSPMQTSDDLTPLSPDLQPQQNLERVDTPFADLSPIALENSDIMNVVTDPDGTTVIEELDTPAIRRAKGKARKRRKVEGMDATKALDSAADYAIQNQNIIADDVSDLTSLSTLEGSDNDDQPEKVETRDQIATEQESRIEQSAKDSADGKLKNRQILEEGTLGKGFL